MKIYIDSEYKVHVAPGAGLREFDSEFFDGKCAPLIEGYRYIPTGERWVTGVELKPRIVGDTVEYEEVEQAIYGEAIFPWRDYSVLEEFQTQADGMDEAHMEELAELVENIYNEDMEMFEE